MSRAPAAPLPPERFEEILRCRAQRFGLGAGLGRAEPLSRYLSELDRWRQHLNLTGGLSAEQLADHTLESLLGSDLIIHGGRVVDIGSGAGFPGLPLAISRPDLAVTLVEPRGKRAAFLRHVVRQLALENVVVAEARIENVGGQTFGFATTRAVGNFSAWIGGSAFLEPGGALLAWVTRPEGIAPELPLFHLEKTVAIPGSTSRKIAVFRKSIELS
jgi:16S rRNA (guanine527-N7)-methyltransferase